MQASTVHLQTGNSKSPLVSRRAIHRASVLKPVRSIRTFDNGDSVELIDRRALLCFLSASCSIGLDLEKPAWAADDFTETASGLRFYDIKEGSGKLPKEGSTCVIHWAGYTEGYQGKRFGNSSLKDEPYEFRLGRKEAIPAIEEAVSGMKVGGVRRLQIVGNHPELGYPRDRSQRFLSSSEESSLYKYRYGPQPNDLGGQRALDFVLDNPTLQDFNRTLLMDVKLLSVRN